MRKPRGENKNPKVASRAKRKLHIRKKVVGSSVKPRVCASKTNKHLRLSVVNDDESKVLFSFQTFGKNSNGLKKNKEGAKALGELTGKKLADAGIKEAVFDRSGYKYTGLIALLAEGLRESGINL